MPRALIIVPASIVTLAIAAVVLLIYSIPEDLAPTQTAAHSRLESAPSLGPDDRAQTLRVKMDPITACILRPGDTVAVIWEPHAREIKQRWTVLVESAIVLSVGREPCASFQDDTICFQTLVLTTEQCVAVFNQANQVGSFRLVLTSE